MFYLNIFSSQLPDPDPQHWLKVLSAHAFEKNYHALVKQDFTA
jgi:hypothetical protein